MESKRKASSANGIESSADDRVAKRRKLQEEFGDLTVVGETPQSTTAYGLNILESIRATTDKNGRPVSPFFETLPPRAENPEYYAKIRLPLSLKIIERKLNKSGYPTLSALESDFKRMVSNIKETQPRQSDVFGDSERVRKAVSNLMVKCNPAYKTVKNYQAVPTPLPPSPGPDDNDADLDEEDAPAEAESSAKATGGKGKVQQKQNDVDLKGEDAEEPATGDDEEDEDDEDVDDDDEPATAGGKRQRPGRQIKSGTPQQSRSVSMSGRGLDSYEGIPYAGLTFQQAQEKVLDDILRKKDAEDYHYFEPFLFLPPRTLKDYFEVITEPCSLRGLQKQVRGQKGRKAATGVTEFKTWAAFEDQASLIWKNAYHYNEDGSEISVMAHELETLFKQLVAEAKQHVPEPAQPQKIKLKVPQNAAEKPAQTPAQTKKITIHVGGKGSAAASPAPAAAPTPAPVPTPSHFGDMESTRNGTPFARNPFGAPGAAPAPFNQLEKARSVSASGPSPSPSVPVAVKPDEFARQSPAIPMQHAAMTTQQHFVPILQPMVAPPNALVQPPPPPPPPPRQSAADILEAQKYRSHPISEYPVTTSASRTGPTHKSLEESEALITKLVISSHPSLQLDSRLGITIPASATETQQELLFNAPAGYFRLQLRPLIAPFLEAQQREWKLNVTHDFTRLYPLATDKRNEPVFDVNLRYGTNRLEVSLVAALPKGQTGPHGLNMEMEKFVVHYNLLKHH